MPMDHGPWWLTIPPLGDHVSLILPSFLFLTFGGFPRFTPICSVSSFCESPTYYSLVMPDLGTYLQVLQRGPFVIVDHLCSYNPSRCLF